MIQGHLSFHACARFESTAGLLSYASWQCDSKCKASPHAMFAEFGTIEGSLHLSHCRESLKGDRVPARGLFPSSDTPQRRSVYHPSTVAVQVTNLHPPDKVNMEPDRELCIHYCLLERSRCLLPMLVWCNVPPYAEGFMSALVVQSICMGPNDAKLLARVQQLI